jgi:hypothetical protein
MHGYDRASLSSQAALLSDAPIPAFVDRLEAIAPLVLDRLGIAAEAA